MAVPTISMSARGPSNAGRSHKVHLKNRPSAQTFAKKQVCCSSFSLDLLLWLAQHQGKLVRAAKAFAVSASSWCSLSLEHIKGSPRDLSFITGNQGWAAVPALELPTSQESSRQEMAI